MWSPSSSDDENNDFYCKHYQSGTREVEPGLEKPANGPGRSSGFSAAPAAAAATATSSTESASGADPTPMTPESRVTSEVNGQGGRRWVASIEVPVEFHGYLIGTGNATRKDMEAGTDCLIIYPARDTKSTTVRVHSSAGPENVVCCLAMIEDTVASAQRKKTSAEVGGKPVREPVSKPLNDKETTHFVALPILDLMVRQRYITFVDMVQTSQFSHESCKVAALFPSKLKLHLTIGMLQIKTQEEKIKALQTMSLIRGRHVGRKPLRAMIEGLVTYDNPARAHVVFAKLAGEGVQRLVDDIRNDFAAAGLISREDKHAHVELQMVVMNSRYAAMAKADSGDKVDFRDRVPFDVTTLFEAHADFDFGPITLDRITICEISSTDPRNGYYKLFGEEIID